MFSSVGEGNPGATRWTLAGLLVAVNYTTKLPRSPQAIRAYHRMWQLVILTGWEICGNVESGRTGRPTCFVKTGERDNDSLSDSRSEMSHVCG